MIILIILLIIIPLALPAQSTQKATRIGDFIESTSYNEHLRNAPRHLQYRPDSSDFVSINGKNRYTRALYGGHSSFRLETSDYPVFASFINRKNCINISFRITTNSGSVPLDSVSYCQARYSAGKRTYLITDSLFHPATIKITALALYHTDGAIIKFEPLNKANLNLTLEAQACEIQNPNLHREGDMGVETPNSLEAAQNPQNLQKLTANLTAPLYFIIENQKIRFIDHLEGETLFNTANQTRDSISSSIIFSTPDPYINTLGPALSTAADAIWNGNVYLHGAVGWRVPLPGWRAAYVADAIGQHDRARTHFNAYAASQVTSVPPTISHPAQDEDLNLARAKKQWGTPMYSNGYICRNPERNNQMHHYDMNLVYIDELLHHINWTGDLTYVRQMWNTLKLHLEWEKRNFDPDNDGLYDAYCCIWASDALYYNAGAVTHSSSYNYRANKIAAALAAKIGENPAPYQQEAQKILNAMNTHLWLPNKGHWAEYKDYMGNQLVHESAALYTIYHAIDNEASNPFQAYQSTRYVDTSIPHIPVQAEGLDANNYAVLSTSNWMPYSWSINNVALAENMHTSLAYFQAGRPNEAFLLLKSNILDAMYLGSSPANFAQMSFYDAARGECYRDFGDPIGITSRTLIQGLFGILPNAINRRLLLRPGFPTHWNHASISTPDISYHFASSQSVDTFHINHHFANIDTLELQLPAKADNIKRISANGSSLPWQTIQNVGELPLISITLPADTNISLTIEWSGKQLNSSLQTIEKIYDPQQVLSYYQLANGLLTNIHLASTPGHHTYFTLVSQGSMKWWKPINIHIEDKTPQATPDFNELIPLNCEMINFDPQLNASITDIFNNKYISPRPPYTTLQIPIQGIGEWCHPKLSAQINDSTLRAFSTNDTFTTSIGLPFRSKQSGNNILFTSLWDNYPDSATIQLNGNATHAYLLMAGTTNHMQSRFTNGIIKIYYTDGTTQQTNLINPDNWCPIEQDYFVDNHAFQAPSPRPYRLSLQTAKLSRNLANELNITGVYGREIPGGAATLLDIPLDPTKSLDHLLIQTIANDVIIGIIALTLQR